MENDIYDRLLGLLCSVLDAYSAVLFLPSTDTHAHSNAADFYAAASFSLGNQVNKGAGIPEGKGLVGWILRNKEPLLVANFDQHQNHLGYYADNEEQTIKAFMGCPLPSGVGALCVDSKRQYSFSEKDQKMLHLFSTLIFRIREGLSDNAESQEALKYYSALKAIYAFRHKHSRWSDFLQNFLTLMVTVTGFSYCVLCTRDAYGENYIVEAENTLLFLKDKNAPPSFPMSHGIVGWVFRNGTAVIKESEDGGPETPLVGNGGESPSFATVMALPLIIQRKTRGVLCFAHDGSFPISETMADFSRMAGEHLSLFLENLYVKCRLRDLHRQTHSN